MTGVLGPILALTGPTACGKTAAGVALAQRLGTEIISADSVQVYRGFDAGSAKPTMEQLSLARHHLIDVADPGEEYNVSRFQSGASAIASELWAGGKLPLVVGGTGLYIKALAEGLNLAVKIGPEAEEELASLWQSGGLPALYQRLKLADPEWAARIHPNDTFRTWRGLGVYLTCGEKMSAIFAKSPGQPMWDTLPVVMDIPWEVLLPRIIRRAEAMLESGWLEEVNILKKMGYNMKDKPMRAVGYRQVFALSEGELDMAQAHDAIVKGTRALARRQLTWLRKVKGAVVIRLSGDETADHIAETILRLDEVRKFFFRHGVTP
jgi:tRNA dimethylallyltransferase